MVSARVAAWVERLCAARRRAWARKAASNLRRLSGFEISFLKKERYHPVLSKFTRSPQDPQVSDAWILYASWQKRLPGTQLVRLPRGQRVSRGTPVALTLRTTQGATARQFVPFLQLKVGHAIFRQWGWQ